MAVQDISIRPVASKADKKAFIDLPYRLYANDPAFVPPLKGAKKEESSRYLETLLKNLRDKVGREK